VRRSAVVLSWSVVDLDHNGRLNGCLRFLRNCKRVTFRLKGWWCRGKIPLSPSGLYLQFKDSSTIFCYWFHRCLRSDPWNHLIASGRMLSGNRMQVTGFARVFCVRASLLNWTLSLVKRVDVVLQVFPLQSLCAVKGKQAVLMYG